MNVMTVAGYRAKIAMIAQAQGKSINALAQEALQERVAL